SGSKTRRLDLAWMDERPFVNVASVGLPPAAARRASGLKGMLGPLAYVVGAIGAGLRSKPVHCVVACADAKVFDGDAWQVTVACSGAFGGGASVDTDPDDGRLEVIVIKAGSRIRLALHGVALRTGEIADRDGVQQHTCKTARIDFAGERSFNVDGEITRHGGPAFKLDPQAYEVVVGP
ncbi:MAG: hypothetical protein M3383_02385, partial [Actinomycetota bacterium]|nr:hypothetical protein [Actinomycetota bacterium]